MGYFIDDKYHNELNVIESKVLVSKYIHELKPGDEIRYVHRSYDGSLIEDDSVQYFKINKLDKKGTRISVTFSNYQTITFVGYDTVTVIVDSDHLSKYKELGNMAIIYKYSEVISELLELAAESFSNRSCNDFKITRLPIDARRKLSELYHTWNGDIEEHENDEDYEYFYDSSLMRYFAHLFDNL